MTMKTIELNDSRAMPQLGLGVWQTTGGQEVDAVAWALEAGYRHIDTAAIYKNEKGVGKAIAQSAVPRDELWVTTKLWNEDVRQGKARDGLKKSLERLGLDYVDLYLIHWPADGYEAAWRTMVDLKAEGLCRSIGVSNFMPEHLAKIVADGVPAIDQIELHPACQQRDVQEACAKHGIVVQGWSPLMQGKFKDEPVLQGVAKTANKSAAQVLIRWALQKGFVTIPKSANQGRIQENFDVFDFELEADAMSAIDALERGERLGPDPRKFSF